MALQIMKNLNFRRFLLGESVALFGYYALQIAISLYLLDITKSAAMFASAFIINTAPTLVFGVMAGVLVDKVNRKRLLITIDLLRAILLLATFGYSLVAELNQLIIFALLLFLGTCNVFFTPAFVTILPAILKKDDFVEGNSIKNTVLEGTKIAAPIIGAFLYTAFGVEVVIILAGLLFVISALFIKTLKIEQNVEMSSKQPVLKDLKEGFLVFRDSRLTSLVINGFLTHLFLTAIFQMGFPFIIKEVFNGSNLDIGMIESFATVGIVTSVLGVAYMKNKITVATGILYGIFGMIVTVLPLFLLGNSSFLNWLQDHSLRHLFYFSIVTFGMFWVRGFYGAFFVAFYQQNVEQNKLGRFFSVMSIFFALGQILGFQLFGYLLDHYSLTISIIVLGIGMVLKAIVHIPFMMVDKKYQKSNSLETKAI
ncbi:MFS transporter [Cytobacillus sp. FJAT-54145]|uniref:MFS transporter n=1 Tax=Cytobacillus spartinae TaxID=3299023 RepID=A0ABW6KAY7_9BACI